MNFQLTGRESGTFRGQDVQSWQQRLVSLGWPSLAAEDMAHFLVGSDTQREPPSWANLMMTEEVLRTLAIRDPTVMDVFVAAMERERLLGSDEPKNNQKRR